MESSARPRARTDLLVKQWLNLLFLRNPPNSIPDLVTFPLNRPTMVLYVCHQSYCAKQKICSRTVLFGYYNRDMSQPRKTANFWFHPGFFPSLRLLTFELLWMNVPFIGLSVAIFLRRFECCIWKRKKGKNVIPNAIQKLSWFVDAVISFTFGFQFGPLVSSFEFDFVFAGRIALELLSGNPQIEAEIYIYMLLYSLFVALQHRPRFRSNNVLPHNYRRENWTRIQKHFQLIILNDSDANIWICFRRWAMKLTPIDSIMIYKRTPCIVTRSWIFFIGNFFM